MRGNSINPTVFKTSSVPIHFIKSDVEFGIVI